jgi:hypothetical protein
MAFVSKYGVKVGLALGGFVLGLIVPKGISKVKTLAARKNK